MAEFKFCPQCASPLADAQVNGERRRVCTAGCGFVHYDNPTPVVAAVVEHHGEIVLARNKAWPRTFYGLITGFLERGESPEHCAVREVKEELNLDSAAPTLIGAYEFERMNQVIIAYHVAATGDIVLNEELDDFRHVPFERCRYWPAGTGYALRDWLRSRGYEPEMIQLR
jgi:NADH pyrophosphatase NudC (nudix superfamily)